MDRPLTAYIEVDFGPEMDKQAQEALRAKLLDVGLMTKGDPTFSSRNGKARFTWEITQYRPLAIR